MNAFLDAVEKFARTAHQGQRRKYEDAPYIVHPIRVKNLCAEYVDNIAILAAALLHDVLEDTSCTEKELAAFLQSVTDRDMAERTMEIVIGMTDIYTKLSFPGMNRKKRKANEANRLSATSPDTQSLKYADIIDNVRTLGNAEFRATYLREAGVLLSCMKKGHPDLRALAIKTVAEN